MARKPSPTALQRVRNRLLLLSSGNDPKVAALLSKRGDAPGLIGEYRKARRFSATVDPEQVRRVIVLSMSRSGTHNFVSRFHYLARAFVMKENSFSSRNEPLRFENFPRSVAPWHSFYNMFLEQGLQEKQGADLTHLFYIYNHCLRNAEPLNLHGLDPARDRLIYYLRNPFRVIFSLDRRGHATGKRDLMMTEENYRFILQRQRFRLQEMLALLDASPTLYNVCFHEIFCAQPEHCFHALCDFLGLPREDRAGWDDPSGFFKRCFGTGEKPEVRDGQLWCPRLRCHIQGTGANYNPIMPVQLSRTQQDPIGEFMVGSRYDLAVEAFGNELSRFWLEDATFSYSTAAPEDLVALIRRSLATT